MSDGSIDTLAVSLAAYNKYGVRQMIALKIRRWLQHRNGIMWGNVNGANSYAVQRSGDRVNWTIVYRQPITVNRQRSADYYNDSSPLSGTNYYRLQTTSTNGAINYSNVIAITADEDAIKISPNPATNSLHIEGLSAGRQGLSANTKLTVIDFAGNIKLQAFSNSNSYNLNIASLTTGNYLLKIKMNNDVVTKKFVKE
ncbi:MAG: T9SS type A sorting domain-containing protein [Parafilimonas sp.]